MVYLNHRHRSRDSTQVGKLSPKLDRPPTKSPTSRRNTPGSGAGEHTGDDPEPRNRWHAPSDRARNSLNRVVLAQKGCKISPNRAQLSSRRQLEHRRASNWEAFAANPTRLGFMERAVEDFPLLLSILLERERREERCRGSVGMLFPFSLPPRPTRL